MYEIEKLLIFFVVIAVGMVYAHVSVSFGPEQEDIDELDRMIALHRQSLKELQGIKDLDSD